MRSIRDPNVPFQESIGESLPVLGICLGMEMYFEQSQEGKERGFAALKGDVILLPDTIKVPHMGWNSLQMQGDSKLLAGIKDEKIWAYFVHSYRIFPKDSSIIKATADYGISHFCTCKKFKQSGLLIWDKFGPCKPDSTILYSIMLLHDAK